MRAVLKISAICILCNLLAACAGGRPPPDPRVVRPPPTPIPVNRSCVPNDTPPPPAA
jgi:hypothetical protein